MVIATGKDTHKKNAHLIIPILTGKGERITPNQERRLLWRRRARRMAFFFLMRRCSRLIVLFLAIG